MGPRLLCCVTLCLLGAGYLDTAVSQTPKHLVTQKGNKESLKCEQNLGHNAMYWYKQDSDKLLKIMFVYNIQELILNETVAWRFLPESPDRAHLYLHINSLNPGDSATYFCASSKDTALQTHLLPVYKPPGLARKPWGHVFTWAPVKPLTRVSAYKTACQYTQWASSTFYAHGSLTEFYLRATAVYNKFTEVFRIPQATKNSVPCTANLN